MFCQRFADTMMPSHPAGQLYISSPTNFLSGVGQQHGSQSRNCKSVSIRLLEELGGWDGRAAFERLREWTGEPESGETIGYGLLLGRVVRSDLEDDAVLGIIAHRLASAYLGLDETFKAPYFDLAA